MDPVALLNFIGPRVWCLRVELRFGSLKIVKEEMEWMQRQLWRMQCLLQDADAEAEVEEIVRNRVEEIRDVAYSAQDIIDTYLFKIMKEPQHSGLIRRLILLQTQYITFSKISAEIIQMKRYIEELSENMWRYGGFMRRTRVGGEEDTFLANQNQVLLQYWTAGTSSSSSSGDDDMVVGLEGEREALLRRLMEEEGGAGGPLRVIPVLGRRGCGKTTLASTLYNKCLQVKKHFPCRAWVYVSPSYGAKEILEGIGKQVMGLPREALEKMSSSELEKRVLLVLNKTRYLIVLDDLVNSQVYNDLKAAFPDVSNGSRILLTTHIQDLALHLGPAASPSHQMLPLTPHHCWDLFLTKLTTTCPPGLEKLGRQIVAKCDGLPLAVALLGGLLSTKEKKWSVWRKVLQSVNRQLAQDPSPYSAVLAVSYNNLPYYLRSCFLYFGLFPQGFQIPAKRLTRLLVAEGLIQTMGDEVMEDVAEDYLEELIVRGIIQVTRKSPDGRVVMCRIHNMSWDFTISEASESRFFDIVLNNNTVALRNVRRLGIHSHISDTSSIDQMNPHLRTLFFSPVGSRQSGSGLNFVGRGFKLLRVLELEGVDIHRLPYWLVRLVHLRYLRLTKTRLEKFPSAIRKLFNLQTIQIEVNCCDTIPDIFRNLDKLRHLCLRKGVIKGNILLGKLRSLQTLHLGAGSWIENDLHKLSALRELRIEGLSSYSTSFSFPQSIYLNKMHLEGRLTALPSQFPLNLSKLTLKHSELEQDSMHILEKLPNLQTLKLLKDSYIGKEMLCSHEGFNRLQVLEVEHLHKLESWKIEEGAMLRLKNLKIANCNLLHRIPEGLEHLNMLQELELLGMPEELKIRIGDEEGEDYNKIREIPCVVIR